MQDEIPKLFLQIEEALASGLYVAGYMSYESGYHFERFDVMEKSADPLPLAWFGVYLKPLIYDHETGTVEGTWASPPVEQALGKTAGCEPDPSTAKTALEEMPVRFADRATLGLEEEDYCAKIERIQQYIGAGDTYQVNFTSKVRMAVTLSADAAFRTLLRQQPVAYGAFLHVAGHHILSLSPELFFKTEQGRILTRPMKGTMPRGLDAGEDAETAIRLGNDEKNRCEHVMIVDLLRNDLGRICTMGSLRVEDLFSVEKYETLLQMTSTISGTLRPGLGYYEIFKSMFPSGSITGAPKIRTMQIIREMEEAPRGIYTGSIGFMAPDGSSAFNVAIRTVVLQGKDASMGVGGGIVADSDPAAEYRECLLKAAFLTRTRPEFQLLETMLWDGRFPFLLEHLDRLEASAAYFDFELDRSSVAARITAIADLFDPGARYRVRLLLDAAGRVTITHRPHTPDPSPMRIRLSPERTSSGDVFLRHKTTHRKLYDRLYAEALADGFDEVIFMNEREELTEGAISNLFLRKAGRLITPPLLSGVLPGVLRRHLLETDAAAEEGILTLQEIQSADAVFLCNAVRGIRPVRSLLLAPSTRLEFDSL